MTRTFVIAVHSRIRIPVTSSEGIEGADKLEKSLEAVVLMQEGVCGNVWAGGTQYECVCSGYLNSEKKKNKQIKNLHTNYMVTL